ncbi:hypothetical protein GX586_11305 [bacterium]|nr:hypothetical protein [bacterium]
MLILSIVLFAIAAVIGAAIVYLRLKAREVSIGTALAHGAFAAAGLVVLILEATTGPRVPREMVALALFAVAALGGFLLFALHLKARKLPLALMGVHGVVAVAGFLLLLSVLIAA